MNLVELRNLLRSDEDVFFDYSGEIHNTIAECDKANTKIRHKLFKERLMALATKKLEDDWGDDS